MITLFKSPMVANRRSLVFPKMSYVQKRMSENTKRALDYYRNSGEAVKSNHPLVTLINSMNAIWSGDLPRFFDVCDAMSPSVCNAMKIGGAIHSSHLKQYGTFYGDTEVLLNVVLDRETISPWYEICPVKVFTHGRTDLTYTLLDGIPNTDEDSFSVVGIDVGLLMYMFLCWYEYQKKVYPDNYQTVAQFVANFVLPNMITSHNDVAWMNRVSRTLEGSYSKLAPTVKRTPFALATSETFTNDLLRSMSDTFTRQEYEWADILSSIPLPSGTTAFAYAQHPKFYPTRLGKAMACLTTLGELELLVSCKPNSENSKHYVELERALTRYKNEKWFTDRNLANFVEAKLSYLMGKLPT